jgi:hypothetical protein
MCTCARYICTCTHGHSAHLVAGLAYKSSRSRGNAYRYALHLHVILAIIARFHSLYETK